MNRNHSSNKAHRSRSAKWALIAGAIFAFGASMSLAQSTPPAAPPLSEKKADPLPGLDELLGIKPAPKPAVPRPEGPVEPAPPDGAPELDPLRLELERKLNAKELAERFEVAVQQMGESADRIERAGDVGVLTQRLQNEVLKNLDLIIKQSNEGQGGGSGQKQQSGKDEGGKQQPTPQQAQENKAGPGENKGQALMPPAMVEAELRKGRLETARAQWGNLPERTRESLMQGSSDYFSALYQAMTEAYYKKLAEEGKE